MANDDHVALLKEGVTNWNMWRYSSESKPNKASVLNCPSSGRRTATSTKSEPAAGVVKHVTFGPASFR